MSKNKKKSNPKENPQIEKDWDTIGIEILFQKDKQEFTPSEKSIIKEMLKIAPPPIHFRRKVSLLNLNI